MQTKTDKEKLSFHQQNKEILSKAIKIKTNKKIHEADEINTLTLNNQSKCLEQKQIDFTIEKVKWKISTQKLAQKKQGSKSIYFKTKVKFHIVKIEDQLTVSLKNTYKIIKIEKKEKRFF